MEKKKIIFNKIASFLNLELFSRNGFYRMSSLYSLVNSFHSFWANNLKLGTDVASRRLMCTSLFWKKKIVLAKQRPFQTLRFFKNWLILAVKFVQSTSTTLFEQLVCNFAQMIQTY